MTWYQIKNSVLIGRNLVLEKPHYIIFFFLIAPKPVKTLSQAGSHPHTGIWESLEVRFPSSANNSVILNLDVSLKSYLQMKYHPINSIPNALLMNSDICYTTSKGSLESKTNEKNFFICTINISLKSFI